jgi:tRNA A37 threonylcarbamoyltransferase TsaD
MIVLGIETSCDETAASGVGPGDPGAALVADRLGYSATAGGEP